MKHLIAITLTLAILFVYNVSQRPFTSVHQLDFEQWLSTTYPKGSYSSPSPDAYSLVLTHSAGGPNEAHRQRWLITQAKHGTDKMYRLLLLARDAHIFDRDVKSPESLSGKDGTYLLKLQKDDRTLFRGTFTKKEVAANFRLQLLFTLMLEYRNQ